MLKDLHTHFQLILTCELIKVCVSFVAYHLVLVVTEAEEDAGLAVLKAWVDYLKLHKLTRELDRQGVSHDLGRICGTLFAARVSTLDQPKTDFV